MSTIAIERVSADALATSTLAREASDGRLHVRGFSVAREFGALAAPEERFDPERRTALAETLERELSALTPHVAVLDSVRALRRPSTWAVVSGQQPALFGGPLYSLYKALHAVRLARSLAHAWERPVVPLFWNHADDHDVAEAHHAYLLNENLDLQKIALPGLSSGRQPLSRIVLREEQHHLNAVRELAAQTLERGEHAREAVDLFAPREGETLARAFTRSMTGLLGHLGLVVVEPDWIRDDLSRALAAIVSERHAGLLQEGAERVRAAGHEVAIDPAGAALVFRVDERGRHALRAGGDGFRYDGEPGSRTGAELAAEMVQTPSAWSPGALLRPIAQDLCLPTAAYVGGWGELAYHAQLSALRTAVGAPATPFVPRWSCTLVDQETRFALARLGLTIERVLAARGGVEELVASDASSAPSTLPPVVGELRAVAERAARDLLDLRPELAKIDRALAKNLARTAGQVRGLVERTCEKAERVHANKLGKGRRHVRRTSNMLFPRGEPQERILGPMQFVARFGTTWIDELFAALGPFEAQHVVANFAGDALVEEEP